MPPAMQRALWPLDRAAGSRRGAAALGHTLLLIARRDQGGSTNARDETSGPGTPGGIR